MRPSLLLAGRSVFLQMGNEIHEGEFQAKLAQKNMVA
jgi:hypothetical protein